MGEKLRKTRQERNERLKTSLKKGMKYAGEIFAIGPYMQPVGRAVRFLGSQLYSVRTELGDLQGRMADVESQVDKQGKKLSSLETSVGNVPSVAAAAAQKAVDESVNRTSPETAEVHRILTTEVEVEGKKLSGVELVRKAFTVFPPIVRKWFEAFEAKEQVQEQQPQTAEVDREQLRVVLEEMLPSLVAQQVGKTEEPAVQSVDVAPVEEAPEQAAEAESQEPEPVEKAQIKEPEPEEAEEPVEAAVVPLRAVPAPVEQEAEAQESDEAESDADAEPQEPVEQEPSSQQWDMEPVSTVDAQEEEEQEQEQEASAEEQQGKVDPAIIDSLDILKRNVIRAGEKLGVDLEFTTDEPEQSANDMLEALGVLYGELDQEFVSDAETLPDKVQDCRDGLYMLKELMTNSETKGDE